MVSLLSATFLSSSEYGLHYFALPALQSDFWIVPRESVQLLCKYEIILIYGMEQPVMEVAGKGGIDDF